MIPAISSAWKDWLQVLAWGAAVLGGGVALFKARHEVVQNREQRQRELRWEQARAAKELLDEMLSDEGTDAALTMLDWEGREYEVAPNVMKLINGEDRLAALRVTNLKFIDVEAFSGMPRYALHFAAMMYTTSRMGPFSSMMSHSRLTTTPRR
jgi:hypothetical protein